LIIDPEDADDRHVPSAAPAANGSDDESEDEDEDETEELMRELERIKKERAAEAAKREREAAETEAREADSAILQGNPLLDPTRLGAAVGGQTTFSVKRRCAIRCLAPARAPRHRTRLPPPSGILLSPVQSRPNARRPCLPSRYSLLTAPLTQECTQGGEHSHWRAFSHPECSLCLMHKTCTAPALSHCPSPQPVSPASPRGISQVGRRRGVQESGARAQEGGAALHQRHGA
jgi:hypothetical protein